MSSTFFELLGQTLEEVRPPPELLNGRCVMSNSDRAAQRDGVLEYLAETMSKALASEGHAVPKDKLIKALNEASTSDSSKAGTGISVGGVTVACNCAVCCT